MGLKINIGSKTKPTRSKSTTSKSTTKAPRRNRATGPANAVKDTPKRSGRKPATAKSTPTSRGERRSAKTDMSQTQLKKLLGPLKTHADRREDFRLKWLDEVAKSQQLMLEALDSGVPVGLVMEHAQVSRQHIYKVLGERSKNGSGSKSRAKAAAKSGVKKTTSKTTAKSSSKKTGKTRPKIRAGR